MGDFFKPCPSRAKAGCGMRIKDLEKTRKLGAQGIAGVSAF
jgi:hypothetical protein